MALTLRSEVLGHRGSEETGPLWPVARRALLRLCGAVNSGPYRFGRHFRAGSTLQRFPAPFIDTALALSLSLSLNACRASIFGGNIYRRRRRKDWRKYAVPDRSESSPLPSPFSLCRARVVAPSGGGGGGGEGSRIGHPAATLTLIYSRDTRVKI